MADSDTHILETRPKKRTRRTAGLPDNQNHPSDASSSSTSTLQRHHEIWFEDGNIVLAAQGTAFRIYRGLISGQSTVFSDMFASSTSLPSETFDGCPVVHLSDSSYDLAQLLRVLLPQSHIQYHTPKEEPIPRTFDQVSAVIRLTHKYDIQGVQDQALAYMQEHCYPSDFAVFSSLSLHSEFSSEFSPGIVLEPAHAIGAVNLARLTDTPSILPLPLYHCACLSAGALLDGWARADGTVERLSDADLRTCLEARVALTHERFFLVSRLFDDTPSEDCQSEARCAKELRFLQRVATRSRGILRAEGKDEEGVLRNWEPLVRSLSNGPQSVCGSCIEMVVERALLGRKRLWNRLPRMFGVEVEGWGEPGIEPDPEDSGNDNDDE